MTKFFRGRKRVPMSTTLDGVFEMDEKAWKEFNENYQIHEKRKAQNFEQARAHDPVEQPSHYQIFEDFEACDAIRAVLDSTNLSPWQGYCLGNFLKYRLRAGEKDGLEQDIAKSEVYRRWLNESSPIGE